MQWQHGGRSISLSQSDASGDDGLSSPDDTIQPSSSDVEIQLVRDNTGLKKFYQVPFQIYQDNPYWVAPFWYEMKSFFHKRNPFWSHAEAQLFLAKKNNMMVGRVAAIIDQSYCKMVGEDVGFFGFFECIKDYKCAKQLLGAAERWLVSKKMNLMRGPIDGRVDVGCGFLSLGYKNRCSLLSIYTPAYYIDFAEQYGLKKIREVLLYHIDLSKPLPRKLAEKAQQCLASGVQVRTFNRLRTGRELGWWIDLFLETFADHWGYVPVSADEVKTRFGIQQLRWFVDTKLFLVAEWDGTPVAYLWSTPEYNEVFQKMNGRLGPLQLLRFLSRKQTIKTGKLHLIGIKKEHRNKNIASLLNYQVLAEMKNRGYRGAEVGWIDEQNTIAHTTIALTGARVSKKHRVFEKSLSG